MDEHGDNIVVTDEVAEKLGLEGVGISNDELEVKVEDFLDKVKDELRILHAEGEASEKLRGTGDA